MNAIGTTPGSAWNPSSYSAAPAASGVTPSAGYYVDSYAGAGAPVQAQSTSGSATFLGWVGGCLAGAVWAVPKLARFGPLGFIGSAIVVLGCGFYGGKAVGAGEELFQGQPRDAVEVGAWLAGARVAAGAVASMRQPGALVAAGLIWLGSWVAGKVVDLVWPSK